MCTQLQHYTLFKCQCEWALSNVSTMNLTHNDALFLALTFCSMVGAYLFNFLKLEWRIPEYVPGVTKPPSTKSLLLHIISHNNITVQKTTRVRWYTYTWSPSPVWRAYHFLFVLKKISKDIFCRIRNSVKIANAFTFWREIPLNARTVC